MNEMKLVLETQLKALNFSSVDHFRGMKFSAGHRNDNAMFKVQIYHIYHRNYVFFGLSSMINILSSDLIKSYFENYLFSLRIMTW